MAACAGGDDDLTRADETRSIRRASQDLQAIVAQGMSSKRSELFESTSRRGDVCQPVALPSELAHQVRRRRVSLLHATPVGHDDAVADVDEHSGTDARKEPAPVALHALGRPIRADRGRGARKVRPQHLDPCFRCKRRRRAGDVVVSNDISDLHMMWPMGDCDLSPLSACRAVGIRRRQQPSRANIASAVRLTRAPKDAVRTSCDGVASPLERPWPPHACRKRQFNQW